ncbi:hypothetical protein RM704_35980 [Streptomyces sp. DSM 3412]|uniref:Uncharacterized protein n=1 Tax=Streptomyces gottesmaniae TaxID=3075518 RepID=A0ABU2Z890_9ACTN|nr:hypothetical protein [Streptomyces sp. DSM 3412]MDT0572802.1 hypothetical protein [Streptomyces sp. DSM 3412]
MPASQLEAEDGDRDLVLEDLTREQVLCWRTRSVRDHQVGFDRIDRHGERSALRLFTRAFLADVMAGVDQSDGAPGGGSTVPPSRPRSASRLQQGRAGQGFTLTPNRAGRFFDLAATSYL